MKKKVEEKKVEGPTIDPKVQEQIDANRKRREDIDKAFDRIEEKMKDPKYNDRGYDKETILQIPASFFSDFINAEANSKGALVQVQHALSAAYNTIEMLMDVNAELTVKLMDFHLENVDAGLTVANEVLLATQNKAKKK